jgi:Protein of unknown function (DUF1810)
MTDTFDLERFVTAQESVFDTVLNELRAGRKRSHWMWFVFPQLRGLGRSSMAEYYGISSLAEARAYLAHPVLGARLDLCTRTVLESDAAIAPCDFWLARRHEVPLMRNAVNARGRGRGQSFSAHARSVVRRTAGLTERSLSFMAIVTAAGIASLPLQQ